MKRCEILPLHFGRGGIVFQKVFVSAVPEVARLSDAVSNPAAHPTVGVPFGLDDIGSKQFGGNGAMGFSGVDAVEDGE